GAALPFGRASLALPGGRRPGVHRAGESAAASVQRAELPSIHCAPRGIHRAGDRAGAALRSIPRPAHRGSGRHRRDSERAPGGTLQHARQPAISHPRHETTLRRRADDSSGQRADQLHPAAGQRHAIHSAGEGTGSHPYFQPAGRRHVGRRSALRRLLLGGVNSVRGWSAGALGTGGSFLESTLEYRFPISKGRMFGADLEYRGALFVDYANDFNSQGTVLGRPGLVRRKPGDGSGFGLGFHVVGPVGLIRLEGAVNNLGDTSVYFTIGDRY
ncbi:MAG: hypothetical protein FJX76_26340, partial [Armatimonadetes bacterium]|nr:hypothetical protein [Armatimonadota bacterium]